MSKGEQTTSVPDDTSIRLTELLSLIDDDWQAVIDEAVDLVAEATGLPAENVGFFKASDVWWMVVQLGRVRRGDFGAVPVWLLGEDGISTTGSWPVVFGDPRLYVTPDSKLIGAIWDDCFDDRTPPLNFDSQIWAGAVAPYGEDGDWELWFDGEMRQMNGVCHQLWGDGPTDEDEVEWLSIEAEYTGITLSNDRFGCVWGYFAERATVFFGRCNDIGAEVPDMLTELLGTPYTDCDLEISTVSCFRLSPQDAHSLVTSISGRDPNFDADEVEVECLDFEGTAAELEELVSRNIV